MGFPGLLSWLDVAAAPVVVSRCLSLLVSLCVWERKREGDRTQEGEEEREREGGKYIGHKRERRRKGEGRGGIMKIFEDHLT